MRLESKFKYKRAYKEAVLLEDIEIDDEFLVFISKRHEQILEKMAQQIL